MLVDKLGLAGVYSGTGVAITDNGGNGGETPTTPTIPDHLNVTELPQNGQTELKAKTSITASVEIPTGKTLNFTTGEEIRLTTGFRAVAGSSSHLKLGAQCCQLKK